MNKIKVVIADDHSVVRTGLKLLLSNETDIEVVAEANNGKEAIDFCKEFRPNIALLDINMPVLNGIDATVEIKKQTPEVKVLIFTMYEDEELLTKILKSGAAGYVIKKASEEELLNAIRKVHSGEIFLDHTMTQKFVKHMLELPQAENKNNRKTQNGNNDVKLSTREIEVLRLVALGYTDKEIAEKLFISIKTVESHKYRIKDKLNVKRLADLVRYAIEKNILIQK
jgi:two-component system response regulator NreC